MEVKTFDLQHSVFDNETEAILYVIKDQEEIDDLYVLSLPVYTFSVCVKSVEELEDFWSGYNLFGDPVKSEKFLNAMKDAIESFD